MQRTARRSGTCPMVRMAHPLAFCNFLVQVGAPVEKYLRKANLPTLCDSPDALVPVSNAWNFYQISDRQYLEGVGWEAGFRAGVASVNSTLMRRFQMVPTFYTALELLTREVQAENALIRMGLVETDQDVLIWVRHDIDERHLAYDIAQGFALSTALSILRQRLGTDWQPPEIGIRARQLPESARCLFPGTHIRLAQSAGYIRIPRTSFARIESTRCSSPESAASQRLDELSFVDSLRGVVKAYVQDGRFTLESLAPLIGLSARSVRRRLADHGTTYSELVTQVRLSIVKELLEEPDSKIIDAAAAVGYSDPSHFSRAFRRVVGVTPRQYRDAAQSGVLTAPSPTHSPDCP